MSNYRALAYHPTSGRLEVVTFRDLCDAMVAYWSDGFHDGPENEMVRQPDPVDLFLIAQEMAEAVRLDRCPFSAHHFESVGICSKRQRRPAHSGGFGCYRCTALAKWRDFTNAKEKTDG